MTRLTDLQIGEQGRVLDFDGEPSLVQRLLEMGLTDGETVKVLRFAPFGDPIEIRVRGYNLSLRRSEASAVEIEKA